MPFDIASVEKHRKGLNESGKKKWVKIANSVLSKCTKRGGNDCEVSAIKIANSMFESKRVT